MVLDELAPSAEAGRDARVLSALLRAGQTDVVTDHALEALARLRAAEGREVLIAFAHHRRVEARRRALGALARIGDNRDFGVIAQGLRDSSPQVRSDAARLLGDVRARGAVDDLMLALELGVGEAAATIGKLGDADSVERFGRQVGKQPLPVMLQGYANYLERPDLPDTVKLRIVAKLEDVSGAVIKDFFAAKLAQSDSRVSPQVRSAMGVSMGRIRQQQDTTPRSSGGVSQ